VSTNLKRPKRSWIWFSKITKKPSRIC